jgi:hypothetical protein
LLARYSPKNWDRLLAGLVLTEPGLGSLGPLLALLANERFPVGAVALALLIQLRALRIRQTFFSAVELSGNRHQKRLPLAF